MGTWGTGDKGSTEEGWAKYERFEGNGRCQHGEGGRRGSDSDTDFCLRGQSGTSRVGGSLLALAPARDYEDEEVPKFEVFIIQ